MILKLCLGAISFVLAASAIDASAHERHANAFDANGNLGRVIPRPSAKTGLAALIAAHAAANQVPESLVRRVIKRESGGNPREISKGNYGLMQIKLGTARALGYRGSAAGLLDPETNMTYAVKYLAGAYRVAHGNPNLAVHYYAAGYYYVAKHERLAGKRGGMAAAVSAQVSVDSVKRVPRAGTAHAVVSEAVLNTGRLPVP
jgi:soluble lytic murein transglycosylase-like protein